MIKFVVMVNKQGQTRLARYYGVPPTESRYKHEADIVRRCLARGEEQCSFLSYQDYQVIYRRYASLFIIVGVDSTENGLGILELIHCIVETLDNYFQNVCELDIMYNLEKAHFIVDEMICNGFITETNSVCRANIMEPLSALDAK